MVGEIRDGELRKSEANAELSKQMLGKPHTERERERQRGKYWI